jgi:hypothetical protein
MRTLTIWLARVRRRGLQGGTSTAAWSRGAERYCGRRNPDRARGFGAGRRSSKLFSSRYQTDYALALERARCLHLDNGGPPVHQRCDASHGLRITPIVKRLADR